MLKRLKKINPYTAARSFLQNIRLWDTTTTVYHVLTILWDKIIRFDIDVRAAAVAYNFTLAVFPTIIFLFSLIAYIPIEHLDKSIMEFLADAMPIGLYTEAAGTIEEIVSKPRGGVLSLGFLFALYASTSGMMALMRAFNQTYKTVENRGFIKAWMIAIMLNFLLTFMLFTAILFLIIGRLVIDVLFDNGILNKDITFYAIQAITYLVIFGVFFLSVSIIYYIAPAIHNRWKFFNTGSVTASILIILSTNLFSYYLSNFASYNRLYGSIGTIIDLMVWIYLIALILLLGFEINASLDHAKKLSAEQLQEKFLEQS